MIQISNINKSFKKKRVLKNISFDIEKGTCVALIGKNGAGKSTLVDILSNKIIADDGVIFDKDNLLQSKNRSIMFQKTIFPDQLKVIEIIKLYQSFYENPLTLDVIIELTKFNSNQLNQFANQLSGGQQRLLDFVISLIGQPQLILLDEPTSNMDIEMREYFWSIIAKLKEENRTILYTSHYIEEVERMSDKIILIENGEVKLNDDTSHIKVNQQSEITLSDEYLSKLKHDANELKILMNHNGTIKILTSNVSDTILYLLQHHINLNDLKYIKYLLSILTLTIKSKGVLYMILNYLKFEFKVLFRKKTALFLSIFFPAIFYILFTSILDLPSDVKLRFYKEYMYSMTVYSLISFSLMAFPIDIINEKQNGWRQKLMATPLTPASYYISKIVKTMAQFAIAIIVIFMIGHFYKGVTLSISQWIESGVLLWLGASLLITFGVLFSLINDIQKASALGNIVTIGLAVLGGLWFSVNTFPNWLQHIAHVLPSYHLRKLGLDIVSNHHIDLRSFGILILYAVGSLIVVYCIRHFKRAE